MGPAACKAPGTLQTCLPLAALATAPGCARGHVRSVAAEWGMAELADTAELLVSELVTNAVRACEHLRARADVATVPVTCVWLTSDGRSMMIHVWDPSDEMPVRRHSGFDDESGRGLMLVDHLAKDWGAYRKDGGKVVWAQITGEP
jgi:hypothetical protein